MADLSKMSDEELQAIAGVEAPQAPAQSSVSSMSDEQLQAIANQSETSMSPAPTAPQSQPTMQSDEQSIDYSIKGVANQALSNQNWNDFKSQVYAGYMGSKKMVQSLGATVAKAAAHVLDPSRKKDIQELYERDYQEYVNDPDVQKNPMSAFAGEMAATAGVPLGAAKNVYTAAKPVIGKLLGGASGMAAGSGEGVLLGGSMTQPGQGEAVLNKQGMIVGGLAGGGLAPVTMKAAEFAKRSVNYSKMLDNRGVYYKGDKIADYKAPVLARDFVDDYAKKLGNQFWDNMGGLGTTASREAQVEGMQEVMGQLGKALIIKSQGSPLSVIESSIKRANKTFIDQRNESFTKVYNQLDSLYPKMPISNDIRTLSKNILDESGAMLQKEDRKILRTLSMAKEMKPSAIKDSKGYIWGILDTLKRKTNTKAPQDYAITNLPKLYGAIKDNVENNIQDNLPLLYDLKAANQFEMVRQKLFDPKLSKKMVDVIHDKSENLAQTQKFTKWLLSPDRTDREVRTYMGLMGKEGSEAVTAQKFTQLMDSSVDYSLEKPVLNLHKFIKTLESERKTGQKYIIDDAYDALQGVLAIAGKPNVQAKLDAQASQQFAKNFKYIMGTVLLSGGYMSGGAAGVGAMGAGIYATMKTLAAISTHSPLKRTLRMINKAVDQPGLSEYLIERAADIMQRMGIVSGVNEQGELMLDKVDKPKK